MITLVTNARAPKTQVVRTSDEVEEGEDKGSSIADETGDDGTWEAVFVLILVEDVIADILRARCI